MCHLDLSTNCFYDVYHIVQSSTCSLLHQYPAWLRVKVRHEQQAQGQARDTARLELIMGTNE